MAESQPWTIGRLLQWTTDYLKRCGADSPRLDAEVLLAEAMQCPRIALYTSFDQVPSERVRATFREWVRRRAQGAPVAYLTGHREFFSMSFRVTPDVLIPRPETELLVMRLIELGRQRAPGPLTICDVGTGSGIIAVAAARHLPFSQVTALDISAAALGVARSNAEAHGVQERIAFVQSDLFAAIPPQQRFDFVVSNPPYVAEAELEVLAPEVRQFEPRVALVAGQRGTEVIERLLAQAADRLQPGGHLLLEISPMIHQAVQELLVADDRYQPGSTIKDTARLPRVVQAQRK